MQSPGFKLSELQRRLSCMINIGVVSEINTQTKRVKVKFSGLETTWLPWITARASDTITWSPPSVNEQVVILAPDGDLNRGIVLGSLYQNKYPAPSEDVNTHVMQFPDGTQLCYNSDEKRLSIMAVGDLNVDVKNNTEFSGHNITLSAEKNLTLKSDDTITLSAKTLNIDCNEVNITGNLNVTGNINATGNILASGQNSNHHSHF